MPNLFDENQKLSHRLQGLVNALGDEITETLNQAADRVTARILLFESKAGETESLVRRRRYLEAQKTEIDRVLGEVYSDISGRIKDKSVETAQAGTEIQADIIKKVVPARFQITMGVPTITKKRALLWFESSQIEGLFFNDYLKKLEANTAARIIKESRLALISGETEKTAAKRIQQVLEIGRHSAQALAETSIRQAEHFAHREFYLENVERLAGLRYVAELDKQTCPRCVPLDNQVFKVDECPAPPLHMRCRCFTLPVFKYDALNRYLDEEEKNVRIARIDTDARTVHHRDGTTSTEYQTLRVQFPHAKVSYTEWMQGMATSKNPADAAFAREALGPARFDLVASGKLKLSSLYYGGKLRTIKELKELMK